MPAAHRDHTSQNDSYIVVLSSLFVLPRPTILLVCRSRQRLLQNLLHHDPNVPLHLIDVEGGWDIFSVNDSERSLMTPTEWRFHLGSKFVDGVDPGLHDPLFPLDQDYVDVRILKSRGVFGRNSLCAGHLGLWASLCHPVVRIGHT